MTASVEKLVSNQDLDQGARSVWTTPEVIRVVAGLAEAGGTGNADGNAGGRS